MPRRSSSCTIVASAMSSTEYTCGSPADCDARMYPHRAHWPIVEPDTPASSPTSPARKCPCGLGARLPGGKSGVALLDLVGQAGSLVERRTAGPAARVGVVEQGREG